jgi:molybdopterin molybdotransferase
MPEFLTLIPPDIARNRLLANVEAASIPSETVDTESALGRVTAADVRAPHPLPAFIRSTVDGFAVRARDTYGAG